MLHAFLHLDAQGQYHDCHFTDILDLLNEGDLLILNDTKVMKARLKGKRASGGAVEVFSRTDAGQVYCTLPH